MRFSEVVGQYAVKERLIRTFHSGRISHAQLFFGPEGSGALPLALAYAQYLNCSNKQENTAEELISADSCGTCPSCQKFQKLVHPDLHFIFPVATTAQVSRNPVSRNFYDKWRAFIAQNNGYGNLMDWYTEIGIDRKQGLINADDCSEILRTLSYKSYQGGYKIMVIWMVERLFHSAAPKILKVLEEPPDQTVFLLITENPDQIIRTIKSRTQLVKIPAILDPVMEQSLKGRYPDAGKGLNDAVRLAQGNFREAIRILNDANPDHQLFERFRLWMRLCFKNAYGEILEMVRDLSAEGRESQKQFLNYALRIVRESLWLDVRGEALSRLSSEELDFVRNFSPFVNQSNGPAFASLLEESIHHIERNANPGILFTWVSIRFSALLRIKDR